MKKCQALQVITCGIRPIRVDWDIKPELCTGKGICQCFGCGGFFCYLHIRAISTGDTPQLINGVWQIPSEWYCRDCSPDERDRQASEIVLVK